MTTYRVEGFNQLRLLNDLREGGVAVSCVDKESSSVMRLDVPQKHTVKFVAICRQMCYNISVVKSRNVRAVGGFCVKRAGVLVGTLIFLTALILSQLVVWRIDVSGLDDRYDNVRVRNILRDNNIGTFMQRGAVDLDDIVAILESQDFVAAAAAEMRGTTLVVNIVPQLGYTPPNIGEPTDIISGYDAVVTRVVARSGTPAVRSGDAVSHGSVLIGAYAMGTQPDGEELYAVHADGEVWGRVYFGHNISFGLVETRTVRTGRSVTHTALTFRGLSIFDNNRPSPFEHYEYVKAEQYLSHNLLLPLMYVRHTYYELETVTTTFESGEARVPELIRQIESEFILSGYYDIIGTTYTLRQVGDLFFLSAFVEVETLISTRQTA